MLRPDLVALVTCGVAVAAAAALGSLSAIDAADQYAQLDQPVWAPPAWLFGPVWTLLYVGIALTGWQIWMAGRWSANLALWSGQLLVNATWTPLFFTWELRAAALAWIMLLDVLIGVLVVRIWRMGWPAWTLVPYLAWTLFATALNASVWWLNR